MKKLLMSLVAVSVLGLLIAIVGQRPFGKALYSRIIDAQIGTDPLDGLPDGLHVKVCGSGSPMPDPSRAAACLMVIAGEQRLIIDAGGASVRKIAAERINLGKISAVFLTHYHSDHIDGLGELQMQRWANGGATKPLPVYGPQGLSRVVNGLNEAYALDTQYRVAHHTAEIMPPSGAGMTAHEFALAGDMPAVVYDLEGLRVTASLVNHEPIEPAVAYRIDYKGRSVTISGDAYPDPRMTALAGQTDILFHEALNRELVKMISDKLARNGNARLKKIVADIQDYHTSPEEAAQIAEKAGAKALVLYHLVPAVPVSYLKPAFLGDAADYFTGDITIAEDGMLFSLPANAP